MKSKTTRNLLNLFFPFIIQNNEMFLTFIFGKEKSINLLKAGCILLLVLFTATSYSQSCNAKLIVDHDLNVGSSSPNGTNYLMVITNSGNTSNTFSLTALNVNSACSNTDGSSTSGNVALETSFIDINLIPINEISIAPGQSINFYAHVSIPIGTSIKKWSCTEVSAESKTCSNYKMSTVLHTFYSGPDED